MNDWSIDAARETYNIAHWSGGYFDVGANGHLLALPDRGQRSIDLHQLAAELRAAGLTLPVLARFTDILHDRITTLQQAFATAMAADHFTGGYTAVYPIKVNQQRSVVEELLAAGGDGVGLEAGSKPELLAVLALTRPGGLVVCNGYKDREYIRLALIGLRLGLRVHIVIEKLSELDLVMAQARALGVTPLLGIRVRLASIGAGKWQNTGGEKSKFGLGAAQVLEVIERLRGEGLLDSLRLLHFHLGSQIANIRDIQRGMRECARYYAELRRLGAPLEIVDVGGGLGVDYEGTRSRSFCSMNYSVQEYANNVVHALLEVCQQQGLPHPHVVTESGRALTAHHAVLITNVIDHEAISDQRPEPPETAESPVVHDLARVLDDVAATDTDARTAVEAYHDAVHGLGEAHGMYLHGVIGLHERARAEAFYFAICARVRALLSQTRRSQREVVDELDEKLADKYFCNFSLFQSMPDVWGIAQIFPIVPLHRLDQPPTRRAVLQDITCDSDGRIDHYVDGEGVEPSLPLHPLQPGEPYLLGFFLVGAYQEILGDMHNLFGDTDSVDIELTADGHRLRHAQRGDTVDSVLRYVHFNSNELLGIFRERTASANLSAEARRACLDELEAGLRGYTYLEE